jgi:predicted MFS family arabinose efflux permease
MTGARSPGAGVSDEPRGGPLLLATIGLLLALHNANRFGVAGIFGPLRVRFAGAYTAVGNLFSAYPLAYACAQIPVGLLADRLDPRRLILVGTAGATVTAVAFAFTDAYGVALVARLLAGLCGALIYTPAMTFGIAAFPASRRGTAIGVAYIGVGLGTASSLSALPLLVEHVGLTGALLSLAGFAAVMTALAPIGMAVPRPDRPPGRPRAGRLLGQPSFLCLLGFSFLGFLNIYALLTWLPAYLSDALGVAPTRAGALAAVANVTLTVASPLVGKLSDVLPTRRRVLELGALLSLAAFAILAATRSVALVVLASVLAGVAAAMTTAPLFVFAGEQFGAGTAGLAVGLVNAVGQTGSSLSGVVFGPLLDWTGTFAAIWWTCIPIALARYLLLRGVSERRRDGDAGPGAPSPAE